MKNLIKLSLIIIPTIIIVVIFKKDISSLFSFYNSSDVCLDYGFDPNSKEYDKCEIFIKSITFDIECSNDIFKTSIKNLVHKECIQSKPKNNSDKIEQLYACRYEPNEDRYQSSKICFRENGIKPENRKAFNDCTKSKNSSVNECTALKQENYCEKKYDDDEGRHFCANEFFKVLVKRSEIDLLSQDNRRVNCLDRGFIFKSDKYYDCYYSEKSEETFDFKLEEYPQCSKNQFRHRCKDTYVDYDGNKYTGEYVDAKKNGQGTHIWKNGDKYVGEWLNDRSTGQGTFTWKNGDKYVGEWLNDRINGQGTYTWKTGDKYVGEWLNDKRTGQGTYTFKNGDVYVGQFLDDKRNGPGILTEPNGLMLNQEYEMGKLVKNYKLSKTLEETNKIKKIKNGDYISLSCKLDYKQNDDDTIETLNEFDLKNLSYNQTMFGLKRGYENEKTIQDASITINQNIVSYTDNIRKLKFDLKNKELNSYIYINNIEKEADGTISKCNIVDAKKWLVDKSKKIFISPKLTGNSLHSFIIGNKWGSKGVLCDANKGPYSWTEYSPRFPQGEAFFVNGKSSLQAQKNTNIKRNFVKNNDNITIQGRVSKYGRNISEWRYVIRQENNGIRVNGTYSFLDRLAIKKDTYVKNKINRFHFKCP